MRQPACSSCSSQCQRPITDICKGWARACAFIGTQQWRSFIKLGSECRRVLLCVMTECLPGNNWTVTRWCDGSLTSVLLWLNHDGVDDPFLSVSPGLQKLADTPAACSLLVRLGFCKSHVACNLWFGLTWQQNQQLRDSAIMMMAPFLEECCERDLLLWSSGI